MSKGTFVKLNRNLQDHWIWTDEPFSKGQAWVDLIMLARWKDEKKLHRGKLVLRKRGEVNCSMRWLAERWQWDRRKVGRFLSLLESDGMITLKCTTNDTTITIENYSTYQDKPTADGTTDSTTDSTTDGTTDGTHKKKEKKDKKGKEGKEYISPLTPLIETLPVELQPNVWEFVEHRKQIKAPMTELALKKMLNKLNDLSGGDTGKCIAILDQSIANGWKGIFQLDEKKDRPRNEVLEMLQKGVFDEFT